MRANWVQPSYSSFDPIMPTNFNTFGLGQGHRKTTTTTINWRYIQIQFANKGTHTKQACHYSLFDPASSNSRNPPTFCSISSISSSRHSSALALSSMSSCCFHEIQSHQPSYHDGCTQLSIFNIFGGQPAT